MVSEELMSRVRAAMRGLKPPGHYDKVYKDECMYTFDTPESPGGLYINLKTWQGFGEDFVALDHEKSGGVLYLHEKWHKVPIPEEPSNGGLDSRPTKLAIGAAGGFQVDAPTYTIDKARSLVLMPDRAVVPLPCEELPELVLQVVKAITEHESAGQQEAVAAWEEERQVSKFAKDLEQLPPHRKISPNPKDWQCDETGVAENLWLNLSTGFIGSGRKNWDGSGGNGAALRHFEATGSKYPLVVKLGTITPSGADVYSYSPEEDDMVSDPWLDQHLAHWGINMMQMEKTEKTMAELQIDLNVKFEFDAITESGAALQPLSGPRHVGLVNLGNSCYMNSVLQVLFTLPEVERRYAQQAARLFSSAPSDAAADLPTQMAKLGVALVTGRTGAPPPLPAAPSTDAAAAAAEAAGAGGDVARATAEARTVGGAGAGAPAGNSVRPQAFKALVGRGHQEFSSARQQDAAEYWAHLLQLLARTEHANADRLGAAPPTAAAFEFQLEYRTQCLESGACSYKRTITNSLELHVPLESAVNAEEVAQYREREAKRQKLKDSQASAYIAQDGSIGADGEPQSASSVLTPGDSEAPVLPVVPFSMCLDQFSGVEVVDGYVSAVLGRKAQAARTARFATFPPYLMLQLKRYYVAEDWTPKKLEVEVPVPDVLDLEHLRGTGPAPGEQLQPEEPEQQAQQQAQAAGGGSSGGSAAAAAAAAAEADSLIVAQLVSMGFSENGSKRAALATNNSSAEAAMEWVLGHMDDPGFDSELPEAAASGGQEAAAGGGGGGADPEKVQALQGMGFGETAAGAALQACGGNMERAVDWLFSHMDDLDEAVAAVLAPAPAAGAAGGGGAAASAPAAAANAGGAASAASRLVDGPGRYQLLAIISHMGSNTACGHYVAHVRKEGRWVIFNDEKVAASEKPPKSLGYMYLYARLGEGAAAGQAENGDSAE